MNNKDYGYELRDNYSYEQTSSTLSEKETDFKKPVLLKNA